jgi:L-alanine-DL-glutamate epimerase-like enolase superfamily enzyme
VTAASSQFAALGVRPIVNAAGPLTRLGGGPLAPEVAAAMVEASAISFKISELQVWQMMYRQHFWHGNGVVRGTAISGIDIALGDILGKVHGVPCHRLWGGPVRDYVRLYCHLGGGRMEDFYEVHPSEAGRFAELASAAVESGFTAFKTMAVPERAVATPIATGERLISQWQVREAYRVAMAPHNPQGPVSTAASLEFGFATSSYVICESVHDDVPWRQDVVSEGFQVEPNGRIVRPSSRPGLGIEIDEDEVRKHPFQQEILQRSFNPDGSITDW